MTPIIEINWTSLIMVLSILSIFAVIGVGVLIVLIYFKVSKIVDKNECISEVRKEN